MNSNELIATLADLVRINSVNPAYAHGETEERIQRYIAGFFEREGIPVEWQELEPGRPNVVAKIQGENPQRRLVLEAHVDTAGIENMTISPFEPVVCDGRLYGRGSCDIKGGLAAMMHAVAAIHRSGKLPPCDVWLAATADEEYSYRGILKFCEGLRADAAIVAEPTDLRVVVATKGCLRWRVTITGRAAHSSKPHLGVNAITHMARYILALEEEQQALRSQEHPLLGSPTLNVGVIQGGAQVNIVPDECFIEIDRRLIPGEAVSVVQHRYDVLADKLRRQYPGLNVSQSPLLADWPMETPADSHIVKVARSALQSLGLDGEPTGVPFGSDASKLARIGIPSIILGPGSIDQAHTEDEFIHVDSVIQAATVYEEIIRRF